MHIAIRRDDGGISIMVLAEGAKPEAEIAKWQEAHGYKLLGWQEVNPNELPQDRVFRDAWTSDGTVIRINIQRARILKLETIRAERNRRLRETDSEMMRVQEQGILAQVNLLKDQRQALRDIPQFASQQINLITDVNQLRDFQPQWPL